MAGVWGEALGQLEVRARAAGELILLLRRQIGQVHIKVTHHIPYTRHQTKPNPIPGIE